MIGWNPLIKKRVKHLSCIEGKGVWKTFAVFYKLTWQLFLSCKISLVSVKNEDLLTIVETFWIQRTESFSVYELSNFGMTFPPLWKRRQLKQYLRNVIIGLCIISFICELKSVSNGNSRIKNSLMFYPLSLLIYNFSTKK